MFPFSDFPNGIIGPIHRTKMHACEVLANDSEGKKLGAGEDGDDRGQKGKSRDTSFQAIADGDVKEDSKPEQGAAKSNQTGELQWGRAKPGHHVEREA